MKQQTHSKKRINRNNHTQRETLSAQRRHQGNRRRGDTPRTVGNRQTHTTRLVTLTTEEPIHNPQGRLKTDANRNGVRIAAVLMIGAPVPRVCDKPIKNESHRFG